MDLHASVSGFLLSAGLILALGFLVSVFAAATAQRGQAWFGSRFASANGFARLDLLALGGSLSPGHRRIASADPFAARPKAAQDTHLATTAVAERGEVPRTGPGCTSASGSTGAATGEDAPKPSERRDHKRYRTCFLGTLHPEPSGRATNLCDILDLSATGARIRPVEPMPALMSEVTVGLERLGKFPARVIWRSHGEVGLRFLPDPEQVMTKMCGLIPKPDQTAAPLPAH